MNLRAAPLPQAPAAAWPRVLEGSVARTIVLEGTSADLCGLSACGIKVVRELDGLPYALKLDPCAGVAFGVA